MPFLSLAFSSFIYFFILEMGMEHGVWMGWNSDVFPAFFGRSIFDFFLNFNMNYPSIWQEKHQSLRFNTWSTNPHPS